MNTIYSDENVEVLEALKRLIELECKVWEIRWHFFKVWKKGKFIQIRLQEKLSKQVWHYDAKKILEPGRKAVIDTNGETHEQSQAIPKAIEHTNKISSEKNYCFR